MGCTREVENCKSGQAPHSSYYPQCQKTALWRRKADEVKMEGKLSQMVREDACRRQRCWCTCHCPWSLLTWWEVWSWSQCYTDMDHVISRQHTEPSLGANIPGDWKCTRNRRPSTGNGDTGCNLSTREVEVENREFKASLGPIVTYSKEPKSKASLVCIYYPKYLW